MTDRRDVCLFHRNFNHSDITDDMRFKVRSQRMQATARSLRFQQTELFSFDCFKSNSHPRSSCSLRSFVCRLSKIGRMNISSEASKKSFRSPPTAVNRFVGSFNVGWMLSFSLVVRDDRIVSLRHFRVHLESTPWTGGVAFADKD